MAFFLGNHGRFVFRRGPDAALAEITSTITPDDVSLSLNRVGFDGSLDNIITGDRIDISTTSASGIAFIPASNWSSNTIENSFSCFVQINEAGGLRLFPTFAAAVNNERSSEITLQSFSGDPLDVTIRLRDVSVNTLANVTSYEFNASREAIDVTSLADKFRNQYNAGLLSGSGRLDCAFDYTTNGINETPLALMQTIQRLDIGASFDAQLYLVDAEITPETQTIFYQATALITAVGVTVPNDGIITATIDFVTTGELRLIFGRPGEYILQENTDRIELDQSVDFLLKEVTD